MLPNAKSLPKATATKKVGIEEYIGSRIGQAVERGYDSTKVWLQAGEVDAASSLLSSRGYKFSTLQVEDNGSTQLLVSW